MMLAEAKEKRIAVAYDLRNRSFTQSWLDEFQQLLKAWVPQSLPRFPTESTGRR